VLVGGRKKTFELNEVQRPIGLPNLDYPQIHRSALFMTMGLTRTYERSGQTNRGRVKGLFVRNLLSHCT
jgi:hypothetical protein